MEKVRYVAAIRKIFDSIHCGESLSKCCDLAAAAKYKALMYNGRIFVRVGGDWVESPFTIEDFEV